MRCFGVHSCALNFESCLRCKYTGLFKGVPIQLSLRLLLRNGVLHVAKIGCLVSIRKAIWTIGGAGACCVF